LHQKVAWEKQQNRSWRQVLQKSK